MHKISIWHDLQHMAPLVHLQQTAVVLSSLQKSISNMLSITILNCRQRKLGMVLILTLKVIFLVRRIFLSLVWIIHSHC